MFGCRLHIHPFHILLTFCDVSLRNFLRRNAFFNCFLNDLVIHIRKIGNVIDIVSLIFKISSYGVKYDHRSCISDMNKIIHGRTADIHFHFPRLQRYKFFFSSCQCVKYFHVSSLSDLSSYSIISYNSILFSSSSIFFIIHIFSSCSF